MLTAIIDARADAERLHIVLSQLTAGAVDGLVRQVVLVARPGQDGIAAICEATGAEAAESFAAAGRLARFDLVLAAAAAFRFRDGWIAALEGQGAPAVVLGQSGGGLFSRAPAAVLVQRALLQQAADDVGALRRRLGLAVRRVG